MSGYVTPGKWLERGQSPTVGVLGCAWLGNPEAMETGLRTDVDGFPGRGGRSLRTGTSNSCGNATTRGQNVCSELEISDFQHFALASPVEIQQDSDLLEVACAFKGGVGTLHSAMELPFAWMIALMGCGKNQKRCKRQEATCVQWNSGEVQWYWMAEGSCDPDDWCETDPLGKKLLRDRDCVVYCLHDYSGSFGEGPVIEWIEG